MNMETNTIWLNSTIYENKKNTLSKKSISFIINSPIDIKNHIEYINLLKNRIVNEEQSITKKANAIKSIIKIFLKINDQNKIVKTIEINEYILDTFYKISIGNQKIELMHYLKKAANMIHGSRYQSSIRSKILSLFALTLIKENIQENFISRLIHYTSRVVLLEFLILLTCYNSIKYYHQWEEIKFDYSEDINRYNMNGEVITNLIKLIQDDLYTKFECVDGILSEDFFAAADILNRLEKTLIRESQTTGDIEQIPPLESNLAPYDKVYNKELIEIGNEFIRYFIMKQHIFFRMGFFKRQTKTTTQHLRSIQDRVQFVINSENITYFYRWNIYMQESFF